MEFFNRIYQKCFLQLYQPFHFHVVWYPDENDAIIFGKSVHFVYESCDEMS